MSTTSTKQLTEKFKKYRLKRRLIIAGSITGILLLGGGLIFAKKVAWPKYKAYQIEQLNLEAKDLLARKDPVNAMLLVRKSLQKSQANIEAWRLGAEAAKARGLTEAMYYQNQVCKMDPTAENTVEMMRITAGFKQYGLVINTGKDAAKIASNIPEYHELMAEAYQVLKRPIAAKYHLEILCSLRPADTQARLNLAAFELENDKDRKDKNLRSRIRGMADQPALRAKALAMLLKEAISNQLRIDTQELLSRFEVLPDLALEDRLLIVQATKLCRPTHLDEQLQRLQTDYETDPSAITAIFDFLTKENESSRVLKWFARLPEPIQKDERLRRATADALFAEKDWRNLVPLLQGGRWENKEYLRHALLAYAYKQQGLITEYFENWKAATMEAGVDPKNCVELLSRVDQWRWESERYDVIWKLFHIFPENEQLKAQLYAWEVRNKNTPNLNRMFVRMIEVDPNDGVALSNFAYSSFLLNANLSRAGLIAKKLHELDPNDPYYLTTYAFSLLKQGKFSEAKETMESLRKSALSQPERLTLFANILAKTGDYERATELIEGIDRNKLLPEEKSLIERAENEIARGSRTRELISKVSSMRDRASQSESNDGGWLASLQPETRAATNPSMALANSLYQTGDLSGMREVLKGNDWLEYEYLRHSLLAYCNRSLGDYVHAGEEWRIALAGAKRSQEPLENLVNLAARWTWPEERLQALNSLYTVTPNNRILLAELLEHYKSNKKTTDLVRLLDIYLAGKTLRGEEAIAYVYYSFLVGVNTSAATVLAQDCMESEPDNTDARGVQAFSLARQSRFEEANRILAETKESSSNLMSIALIQAMVCEGLNDVQGAKTAIDLIEVPALLPEERQLLDKLESKLKARKRAIKAP